MMQIKILIEFLLFSFVLFDVFHILYMRI